MLALISSSLAAGARYSVQGDLFERRLRTLSLRDLLKSKRAAGRVKDLQVIPELESIQEALDQKRAE